MRRGRDILMLLCAAALLVGVLGLAARGSSRPNDPERVCQAAWTGDLEQIRVLSRSGANVNVPDSCGSAPLWGAVTCGYIDVASELLEHGADPGRVVTHQGWSLLHIAAGMGDADMVELLMRYGADLHARTARGYTPLHVACSGHHTQAAPVLIEHGTDIEARTDRGWTPLHLAACMGATGTVEYLLRCGAQTRAVDHSGNTPRDLAKAYDWPEVVLLLAEHSGSEMDGDQTDATGPQGDQPKAAPADNAGGEPEGEG